MLSTSSSICTPFHSSHLKGDRAQSAAMVWRCGRGLKHRKCPKKVRNAPLFSTVALPACQKIRCCFEPTLNLWSSKPVAHGGKRWIVIKGVTWTLKEVCQQRNWKNLKPDLPNYCSEIALEENCREERGGWKYITCKNVFHDSNAEPPLAGLEKEQVSQKTYYLWKS